MRYIKDLRKRGGARGERQGCPSALTGLSGCDIKRWSSEEWVCQRTGRGRGEELPAPPLFFINPSLPHKLRSFFYCFVSAQKHPTEKTEACRRLEIGGEKGNSWKASVLTNSMKGTSTYTATAKSPPHNNYTVMVLLLLAPVLVQASRAGRNPATTHAIFLPCASCRHLVTLICRRTLNVWCYHNETINTLMSVPTRDRKHTQEREKTNKQKKNRQPPHITQPPTHTYASGAVVFSE